MATTRTGTPGDGGEVNTGALRSLSAKVVYAVADLPAASAANKFERAWVNDANSTTFGGTVAAGGANLMPVFSNGTNWIIG